VQRLDGRCGVNGVRGADQHDLQLFALDHLPDIGIGRDAILRREGLRPFSVTITDSGELRFGQRSQRGGVGMADFATAN
jgi:hypothetical protein